jgi:hypothetical protein
MGSNYTGRSSPPEPCDHRAASSLAAVGAPPALAPSICRTFPPSATRAHLQDAWERVIGGMLRARGGIRTRTVHLLKVAPPAIGLRAHKCLARFRCDAMPPVIIYAHLDIACTTDVNHFTWLATE